MREIKTVVWDCYHKEVEFAYILTHILDNEQWISDILLTLLLGSEFALRC